MLRIYNSLTHKKEPLRRKPKGKPLRLFVCGPTVYGPAHIGNARTFVFFDIFVRYLRHRGFKVSYLQNITDVDDKIINRAKEEKTDWKTIAKKYSRIYLSHMKALNVASVDTYAPATKYIPQIIAQVETLINKGNAYEIPGDGWYFDLSTFPDYGKLAGRTVQQAEDGVSRIDVSSEKRNKGDFCLWKFSKPGEPIWNAPFGKGRPGWHIEDTAITEKHFGPQYDMHGGGRDLMFPHHEAEIAQQESASGKKPFVRLWMHANFVTVEGKKMSKSIGNILTIPEMLERHRADIFRIIIASSHYRSPLDYTGTIVKSAKKNLVSIESFMAKLVLIAKNGKGDGQFNPSSYEKRFHKAMEDDMNTPEALAAVFALLNETSPRLWTLSRQSARSIRAFLAQVLDIFGIHPENPSIPSKALKLVEERELYRGNKQFAQADSLRKTIEALGYSLEDTPLGPFLWPLQY